VTDPILERDPALAEIVRRLVAAYQPERIYLFGSMVRGDGDRDSDYDLMVLVPDEAPPERKDSALAYNVLRGIGLSVDVLVWTSSRFERRAHVVASLPATILREGRLLHAA
jgi:predicted nucleotidyltransferase